MQLKYELIPASEANSRRLMIMLHGLGDSMDGYRWVQPALDLPWLNYVLVNAPDGYYGGYSWYDFAGDIVPGVVRSRKLLFELLEAQERMGFASKDTIIGGFSQGCLMAMEVGLRYPHMLAGIVGISGYVCEPEKLIAETSPVARKQRILMTHGTRDTMVPFARVKEQVKLLQSAGLAVEWHEFEKGHTIAGEEELDLIRKFIEACYGERAE
jgi:phospholipase/carboxylesterase